MGQRKLGAKPTDSGGVLMPEQAAYDVTHYHIDLEVIPEEKSILGTVTISAKVMAPSEWVVVDLDTALKVQKSTFKVEGKEAPLEVKRKKGQVWYRSSRMLQVGEEWKLAINYSGHPKEAPRAPWVGGFSWAETPQGAPWIATSVQFDGADLWIPCKDHPSDEPDSVDLHITVPKPLVVASNGQLKGIKKFKGKKTYHWQINTPINNYDIALNIAPYKEVSYEYTNVLGEKMLLRWWVLPSHQKQAEVLLPEFADHLRFYEEKLGPYPFRNEKYGIAEVPFLGMEHQTIIAYGANFKPNAFGFDFLHHHELGHEWWGNMVTAADWKDFWIHEGFCSYMQALYTEEKKGLEGYHQYIGTMRPKIRNIQALAPITSKSTKEKYFHAPCYTESDGDIYTKGVLVLHTLRYLIGEEALMRSLRKMAYPSKEMEGKTDGSQCRLVSSSDFITIAEQESGQDLDWFFEVYLRQPQIPNLLVNKEGDYLSLRWDLPKEMDFPMPLEIEIGGQRQRIEMTGNQAKIPLGNINMEEISIDPDNWIYKKSEYKEKLAFRKQLSEGLPGVTFKELKASDHFSQYYELFIPQPMDHQSPDGDRFMQRAYFGFAGFDRPMILETEGYGAYNYTKEPSKLLQANQLVVEYRFYGRSVPESGIPWEYLTNDQAIEDYHRLVTRLKPIFSSKWVSTGISKGGETTLIYKSKYPNDVDVAIPYVAPIILSREDPRTDIHIQTVGEKSTRDRIAVFQREVLKNRQAILNEIHRYAAEKGMHFKVGEEVALEYAVLEFPFSYWQWGGKPEEIPGKGASAKEQFDYLNRIVGISFYCDKTLDRLAPSYYQHMRELGYYGFDTSNVKDLLEVVKTPTNRFFAPEGVTLTYDNTYMRKVLDYLETKGNNILYIYGGYDTWGACSVNPTDQTNALKMVLEGGSHSTRIKDFSEEDQKKVYATLVKWLNIEVTPLENVCIE
ncbi:hypothetical protein GCM10023331_17470 [Algivirga pacifica]|uniref:Membrane alanyl aminopeptidase n=2 Tax=Algivirga pacifica TaxID=1162670 RepID=A0ABP9DBA3_9BACT